MAHVKLISVYHPQIDAGTHLTVLLFVYSGDTLAGQLALLPNGDKGGPEPQRNDRAEDKPACVEADNRIDTLPWLCESF